MAERVETSNRDLGRMARRLRDLAHLLEHADDPEVVMDVAAGAEQVADEIRERFPTGNLTRPRVKAVEASDD